MVMLYKNSHSGFHFRYLPFKAAIAAFFVSSRHADFAMCSRNLEVNLLGHPGAAATAQQLMT